MLYFRRPFCKMVYFVGFDFPVFMCRSIYHY